MKLSFRKAINRLIRKPVGVLLKWSIDTDTSRLWTKVAQLEAEQTETKELALMATQCLENFVSRENVRPGDLLVFKVKGDVVSTFGVGMAAMLTVNNFLSTMVKGPVRAIVTNKPLEVTKLTQDERKALLRELRK